MTFFSVVQSFCSEWCKFWKLHFPMVCVSLLAFLISDCAYLWHFLHRDYFTSSFWTSSNLHLKKQEQMINIATGLPSDFGIWYGIVWWYNQDLLPRKFQTHNLKISVWNIGIWYFMVYFKLFPWTDRVTYTIRYLRIKSAMLCHICVISPRCPNGGGLQILWMD